jgi:hypothetical protein
MRTNSASATRRASRMRGPSGPRWWFLKAPRELTLTRSAWGFALVVKAQARWTCIFHTGSGRLSRLRGGDLSGS